MTHDRENRSCEMIYRGLDLLVWKDLRYERSKKLMDSRIWKELHVKNFQDLD